MRKSASILIGIVIGLVVLCICLLFSSDKDLPIIILSAIAVMIILLGTRKNKTKDSVPIAWIERGDMKKKSEG